MRFAFALAAVLAAWPAQAGLFDDEVARRQIAEQEKRVNELALQSGQAAARLARIEDALKVQPVLDLANQLELLRSELKSLRGQVEELGNSVEGIAKRQRAMYVDLDLRLRRLEQPGTAVAPPGTAPAAGAPPSAAAPAPSASSPPSAAAAGAAAPPAAAATTDEGRAYDAAQNQRRIGNYQGAIAAFQAFLAQYPRSPLAPRAQYWIGDSHFNLRDFRGAIASQQKLLAAYPESPSVPDALLNIASCQSELGDTAAARKTMDGLVARYPASDAADKARRRLAGLK